MSEPTPLPEAAMVSEPVSAVASNEPYTSIAHWSSAEPATPTSRQSLAECPLIASPWSLAATHVNAIEVSVKAPAVGVPGFAGAADAVVNSDAADGWERPCVLPAVRVTE